MESLASSMSESTAETNSARVATLAQENAVLKTELEVLRMKCRNLQEDNKTLRKASVNIVSVVYVHILYCNINSTTN